MDTSLRNETMSVMASSILSSVGNLLFASSMTTKFYCAHALSGAEVILFMDGTVITQDEATGPIMWEHSIVIFF